MCCLVEYMPPIWFVFAFLDRLILQTKIHFASSLPWLLCLSTQPWLCNLSFACSLFYRVSCISCLNCADIAYLVYLVLAFLSTLTTWFICLSLLSYITYLASPICHFFRSRFAWYRHLSSLLTVFPWPRVTWPRRKVIAVLGIPIKWCLHSPGVSTSRNYPWYQQFK